MNGMVFDKFRVMVVNSWCLLVLVINAGNSDALGTELLESLLKMAPTKEEERKLKEYKDDSPVKLGTAEKFLKELLDVPFAFKRVEAMLYMTNFESEIDYLKKSFETLEVNHTSLSLSLTGPVNLFPFFACNFSILFYTHAKVPSGVISLEFPSCRLPVKN